MSDLRKQDAEEEARRQSEAIDRKMAERRRLYGGAA
jgi:hypothetical protein